MHENEETDELEQPRRRAGIIALLAGMMMSGTGAALSSFAGWPGLVTALVGALLCIAGGIRLVRMRP
jgi:membrane protein YqaA with SNARE-associated domain